MGGDLGTMDVNRRDLFKNPSNTSWNFVEFDVTRSDSGVLARLSSVQGAATLKAERDEAN